MTVGGLRTRRGGVGSGVAGGGVTWVEQTSNGIGLGCGFRVMTVGGWRTSSGGGGPGMAVGVVTGGAVATSVGTAVGAGLVAVASAALSVARAAAVAVDAGRGVLA